MNEYDKKYDSFKISLNREKTETRTPALEKDKTKELSLTEDIFYEVEYGNDSFSEKVLIPQKTEEPVRDEVRELFDQMRDIGRANRSYSYGRSRFFDKQLQQEKSRIFYQQGMFMKDFEDEYPEKAEYMSYFPYYHMMGYKQLRTYFTWRTNVRRGIVEETSLSYAYLYLYELLSNIGVENPEEGLEKLLFFWKNYREWDTSIDKYVRKWLKDYFIYYELPGTFLEFISQNGMESYYPEVLNSGDDFEIYCMISRYDIRKSAFYSGENRKLIQDCFYFIIERTRSVLAKRKISLDEAIFQPVKNKTAWEPFKQALFWPWMPQRDRRVVLSEKEIYVCERNHWMVSKSITTESGRQLVGYLFKQMEAVLRKLKKYKYKLSADINMVHHTVMTFLEVEEIDLEKVITDGVVEFYREATRTVVSVNPESLNRIREEAWQTQEKLTVPEEEFWLAVEEDREEALQSVTDENWGEEMPQSAANENWREEAPQSAADEGQKTEVLMVNAETEPAGDDPWRELRENFSAVELEALAILLSGTEKIKAFADRQGVMLEVLMNGINEKAMDLVGDSLTDEEFKLYEDYIEQIKEMVERA